MTLDEAIEHADEMAMRVGGCCGDEHAQLACWLRELKALRENESPCYVPTTIEQSNA